MSWAAPSRVSRQLEVPGLAFSSLVAWLYGGASGASVELVVVDRVTDDGGAAAPPSSPLPPSCHAATVATATTAAPAEREEALTTPPTQARRASLPPGEGRARRRRELRAGIGHPIERTDANGRITGPAPPALARFAHGPLGPRARHAPSYS